MLWIQDIKSYYHAEIDQRMMIMLLRAASYKNHVIFYSFKEYHESAFLNTVKFSVYFCKQFAI